MCSPKNSKQPPWVFALAHHFGLSFLLASIGALFIVSGLGQLGRCLNQPSPCKDESRAYFIVGGIAVFFALTSLLRGIVIFVGVNKRIEFHRRPASEVDVGDMSTTIPCKGVVCCDNSFCC